MQGIRSFLKWLVVAGVLAAGISFVIGNYSWVFAKRVHGRVVNVERVTDPNAIISAKVTESQLHSYAILIQGDDGKLYTASSDDRQWQVVKKGYCVDALLYVYPPWDLSKANTYFNARMDGLSLCPGETQLPGQEAPAEPPAAHSSLPPALPALPATEKSAH